MPHSEEEHYVGNYSIPFYPFINENEQISNMK